MQYVALGIIPIIASIILIFINQWVGKKILIKERQMSIDNFIICISPTYSLIMFISFGLITGLIIALGISKTIEFYVFIIAISIVTVVVLFAWISIREKVVINGNDIIHYKCIGKTKQYKFEQIVSIKLYKAHTGLSSLKVFSNKKMFTVSNIQVGYNLFLQKINHLRISIGQGGSSRLP